PPEGLAASGSDLKTLGFHSLPSLGSVGFRNLVEGIAALFRRHRSQFGHELFLHALQRGRIRGTPSTGTSRPRAAGPRAAGTPAPGPLPPGPPAPGPPPGPALAAGPLPAAPGAAPPWPPGPPAPFFWNF